MGNGMQVTYFHRNVQPDFSIRRLFSNIRQALPAGVDAKVVVSRFPSRGLWRRVYNIIEAAFRQGDVNHITGDVHFLTYLLHKKRTLLTIHDLVSVHRLKGWRKAALLFFWFWLPIKRAAVVTVISKSTKEDLLRHVKVDPQDIRVVYDCVSEDFKAAPKEFNAAKPVVLLIGTVPNKGKNVERVVQALQGIPCQIRVVGTLDESQTAMLRQCAVAYSSVSNISDEEVVEEFRRCDMLVFASTYEGFGLPIVEAQATGRPVVTSTACSMPEVAGDAACLVDPFDVAGIRDGILKIINDPVYRNELIRRGFENVKRFRADRIAAQYAEIYRELTRRT
jgi:glycosyltransferase involved in cell wall biosynthesis